MMSDYEESGINMQNMENYYELIRATEDSTQDPTYLFTKGDG